MGWYLGQYIDRCIIITNIHQCKIIVTALVYECMLSSKRVRERIRGGGGGGGGKQLYHSEQVITIDGRSVRIINIYYHNAIMIFINIYSL